METKREICESKEAWLSLVVLFKFVDRVNKKKRSQYCKITSMKEHTKT